MKKLGILKRLFSDEVITIPVVDGSKIILESRDVFKSGIDFDFKDWGLNNKGVATKETLIQVYKIVKNANYSQMFNSLSSDLDSLCLTQNQITEFCVKNQKYLEDTWSNFFLFKRRKWWQLRNRYFVARVSVHFDGLRVCVIRFGDDGVWSARFTHRVVVPQLDLEN